MALLTFRTFQDPLQATGATTMRLHFHSAMAAFCALAIFGHPAAAVTIAGAHFFNADGQYGVTNYDREIIDTSGAVNAFSTGFGTGGAFVDARSRASVQSLGIEIDTFGAGAVGASIFEGVQFASPQLPTVGTVLSGYRIAVVGQLTGALSATDRITRNPVPVGNEISFGSYLQLAYFDDLTDRAGALSSNPDLFGATRLFFEDRAGPVSASFQAPTPTPAPTPPSVTGVSVVNFAPTGVDQCGNPRSPTSSSPQCYVGFIGQPKVISFGLGLALSGQILDEFPRSASITAFNSFDLEGLALIDPDGNVVPGLFLSESGADLTLDAFRLGTFAPTTPIPLPAGAILLPAALVILGFATRRRKGTPRA